GGMPPRPRLRSSTSAPIISVMTSSRPHANSSMPSSTRPYQRDKVSIEGLAPALAPPLPAGERVGVRGSMTLDSPSAPHPARFARHPLPGGERKKSSRLREQFLQLRPVLRALADDAVPAGLVGLGEVRLGDGGIERDGLHAGVGLALGLLGVLGLEFGDRFGFA